MEIKNEDKAIFSSGMDGGQDFGVNMGPQLFQVMTSSLYKDKPRAVCREVIANFVDAHRERDFLFLGLDPNTEEYQALLDSGFAPPGTPGEIHIPTEVEPWLEVRDFGIGLTVDKILGQVQIESTGEVVRDGNGHPVRKDGVYTTLFGSDKQTNNRAIGAYGLGCKSPYAISDVFQVISVVNGEEHRFIMFLDSQRSPKVDWLTKDADGEPAPIETDAKNGITVRIDAIPMNMKEKIRLSVSEILQTFPEHEQPIINNGMYKFTPMETEEIYEQLKVVVRSHYGSMFDSNYMVINTGGVIYPLASEKCTELMDYNDLKMLRTFNEDRCIIIDMPLGSVNIPPSREEITYDDWSMDNIKAALTPYVEELRSNLKAVIDNMPLSPIGMMSTVNKLAQYLPREKAASMVRDKIEERKEEIRKLGFTPVFKDSKLRYYSDLPEMAIYGADFRCWTKNQYERVRTLSSFSQVVRDIFRGKQSVNVGRFIQRDGVVLLNDTQYTKSTIAGRFNKLEKEDLLELFPYLKGREGGEVDEPGDIHSLVICGPDADVEKSMEHYEAIAMMYCLAGGFDYVLASEVCERFNRIQKAKAKLAGSISLSELERNVFHVSGSIFRKYTGPGDLMTAEDDKKYLWIPRADFNDYCEIADRYTSKGGLQQALDEILCAESDRRAELFMIEGVRTASRRVVDATPERFIRLDLKTLEAMRLRIEIEALRLIRIEHVRMVDRLAIGLDGVYSKILTRAIMCELESSNTPGWLFWNLTMLKNYPNKVVLKDFIKLVGTTHHDLVTFFVDYYHFFGATSVRNSGRLALKNHKEFGGGRSSIAYKRMPFGTHKDTLPEPSAYKAVGACPVRKEMEVLRAIILLRAIAGHPTNNLLGFPSDAITAKDLEMFRTNDLDSQVRSIIKDVKKKFFDAHQNQRADDDRAHRTKQIKDVLDRFVSGNYPLGRMDLESCVKHAINTFNDAVKVVYPDLVITNMDYTA